MRQWGNLRVEGKLVIYGIYVDLESIDDQDRFIFVRESIEDYIESAVDYICMLHEQDNSGDHNDYENTMNMFKAKTQIVSNISEWLTLLLSKKSKDDQGFTIIDCLSKNRQILDLLIENLKYTAQCS